MRRFFLHWVALTLALWFTDWLLPGVSLSSWVAAIGGAFVLALVQGVVRPVLVLLTLPVTVATLGFFLLFVNGFCFALAAWLVPGFSVTTAWSAVLGSLITVVVSGCVEAVFRERPRRERD